MTDFGLSNQQLSVICALSSGATTTDAAEQAGVHRNTISNWRRNQLPFQYALAHAQYDRAMLYREKAEALADAAIQTIQQILTDSNAPAGVRLKAALAILETVSTPPPPKKQVMLDIEKVKIVNNPEPQTFEAEMPQPSEQNLHKAAQSAPAPASQSVPKSAQTPRTVPPKIGRNEACPCGSGKKYKRCCLGQLADQLAAQLTAAA
jgi:hypothetical protein